MGLDLLDLVFKLEKRFDVRLPSAGCGRVRTVADVAALVLRELPKVTDPCPRVRAFFDLRNTIITELGVPRRAIRPRTRLNDLFPLQTRRSAWAALRQRNPYLPHLVISSRPDGFFLLATIFVGLAWLVSAVPVFDLLGILAGIAYFALSMLLGVFMFNWTKRRLEQAFPPHLETLADIITATTPLPLPGPNTGARLLLELRVLEDVRAIVADVLAVKLEQVKPESDLVKDLDMS